jgi:oligopeptide/dipeptide ABC transporter ATP-binding protein
MDIFKDPKHPYTQGLLDSIPVLCDLKRTAEGKRMLLRAIPGSLPDHRNFPKGCRFAPRCPKVMEKCSKAEPALVEYEEKRSVRCFLHSDEVREDTMVESLRLRQEGRGPKKRSLFKRGSRKKEEEGGS